jgi:curved DNA-binding protein CbpA
MTHYELLQVSADASPEVIDACWKALMRKFHPDKGKGNTELAKKLNEAHDVLSDPIKRQAYDIELSRFNGNGRETAGQRQYREAREQQRASGRRPHSQAYPDAYPRRSFSEDQGPDPADEVVDTFFEATEAADGLIEDLIDKFARTGQVDINSFLVRLNQKAMDTICKRNPLLGAIIQGRRR